MALPSAGLLVSCVNGGGVFLLEGDRVERLSRIDTTGMAAIAGGFLWARQAEGTAELRRLRHGQAHRVSLVDRSLDLHDLHCLDDRLYVVATQQNAVFELDADTFAERRSWYLEGEHDAQHVNSVCVHEGRILASRFGSFSTHRGYKGLTRGAGEVFDVETGEVVIAGLSQPHSLTSFEGRLWLCDSEAHVVRAYASGRPVLEHPFDGYVRGLAFADGHLHVGLSRSRNDVASGVDGARIVTLDPASMQVLGEVALPVAEVYDILPIGDADRGQLFAAALADANAEFDTLAHARNLESLGRMAAEASALGLQERVATAEHERNLAREETRDTREALRLAEARDAAARVVAGRTLREEALWADALLQECGRLRAAIEARDGLLDARARQVEGLATAIRDQAAHAQRVSATNEALAAEGRALASFIGQVVGSRSWKWTRPLRRVDPAPPTLTAAPAALASPHAWADHQAVVAASLRLDAAAWVEVPPAPGPGPGRDVVPILDLAFAAHEAPEVSIVVSAFGNFGQTLACLRSIQAAGAAASFEVIVVEDASGDADMGRLANVPGLRYLANAANLGYLRSVNHAAGHARGRFIHLLNNDTEVAAGWLDALLRTFAMFHECGLAGSRLVYPDGRLQEAGGIVWNDADACNYGRGGDPALLRHAVVREVDYVSAASVLLRTSLWRDLGGFDEAFAPAYYEDTDLAFRVRAAGLRVYVQPGSSVVHHEGLSHGTDPDAGGKAGQVANRGRFLARWQAVLRRDQLAPGEHEFLARDRAQRARCVLVVDEHAPRTDHDAGSRAIWQLMRVLFVKGFQVKFWSQDPGDRGYEDSLRVHGIEAFANRRDGDFDAWFAGHGRYFDHVVLSRPLVAAACIDSVRRHSSAGIVYYGHDIHARRIGRHAALEDDKALWAESRRLATIEASLWEAADLVLYPSAEETAEVLAHLASAGSATMAETVPLFAFEAIEAVVDDAGPQVRDEVLFVGGFQHAPNADGALWFAREVWPRVHAACPHLVLRFIGAAPPDALIAMACPHIVVAGQVSEAELLASYARARIAVAPLRFGAGTKGKVLEALRHGVPCVTTPTGAQGMEGADALVVADTPEGFAAAIVQLAGDADRWWAASREGQSWVSARHSVAGVWGVLSRLLDPQPYTDVEARLAALDAGPGGFGRAGGA